MRFKFIPATPMLIIVALVAALGYRERFPSPALHSVRTEDAEDTTAADSALSPIPTSSPHNAPAICPRWSAVATGVGPRFKLGHAAFLLPQMEIALSDGVGGDASVSSSDRAAGVSGGTAVATGRQLIVVGGDAAPSLDDEGSNEGRVFPGKEIWALDLDERLGAWRLLSASGFAPSDRIAPAVAFTEYNPVTTTSAVAPRRSSSRGGGRLFLFGGRLVGGPNAKQCVDELHALTVQPPFAAAHPPRLLWSAVAVEGEMRPVNI